MRRAFTLVELLVVVLILGALAFIAVPRIATHSQNSKSTACDTTIDVINSQIEVYFVQEGKYPSTLADITDNPDYFPDGSPSCPLGGTYSLNAKKRVTCNHGQTGGGGGCGR